MESVGELLKQTRQKQNKSLNDIAEATKIGKSILEAIEEDRHEFLPPLSYIKGFLRIYARELDLDPYEVVDMYVKALKEKRWEPQKELKEAVPCQPKKKYLYIAAGIALIVLYFVYNGRRPATEHTGRYIDTAAAPPAAVAEKDAVEVPAQAAVKSPDPQNAFTEDHKVVGQPAASPAAEKDAVDVPAQTAVKSPDPRNAFTENHKVVGQPAADGRIQEDGFTIKFVAREMNWIKITVDDREPFEIMLREGETYSQKAEDCMRLRIGNAGGLTLFFNDILLGTPGDPGNPVDLQFPEAAEML